MSNKQKTMLFIIIIIIIGILGGVFYFYNSWKTITKVTIDDVQQKTREKRLENTDVSASSTTSTVALPDEINVLLLGLDSRHTTSSARCDAIHMFTVNTKEKTVEITSVPRGTHVFIPGNYAEDQQYVANSCAIMGFDYAIKEIEKIMEKKSDYIVKVGFSQVLGGLRALKLPTTESLMWLRNRKGFLIGDHQRSHNQAMFIKDIALKKIDLFKNPALLPLAKALYSYVDTDLDFASFYALLRDFADSGINEHPERVTLSMKPNYVVKDYHFDFNNPGAMEKRFPIIVPTTTIPTSTENNSTSTVEVFIPRSLESIQKEIINFINNQLKQNKPLDEIIRKKLWMQVENENIREDFHFRIMQRLVQVEPNFRNKFKIIHEYIDEKKVLEFDSWAKKGEEFLRTTAASSTLY